MVDLVADQDIILFPAIHEITTQAADEDVLIQPTDERVIAIAAINKVFAATAQQEVRIAFAEWQTIQATQMFLARYMRAVADPEHQPDY